MDKIGQRSIGKAWHSDKIAIIYQSAALSAFIILGFVIYANTLNSPFIFDDIPNIKDNPHIRLTKLTLKNIIEAGFESYASYRPIAKISFALNYYLHKYDVTGYHYTNIAIHILTSIFLYLFLKNTLSLLSLSGKYGNYKQIAYFAALLWLVHPIQTQSVTYIIQRMNSLASMFYILSLLLYTKGRLAQRLHKISWPLFAGCILSGILAIGSKQMAATLPVFILLYEWYFFQDLKLSWSKRNLTYIVIVLAVFGILALFYLGLNPFEKILSSYRHRDFTLTERVLTQPRVIIHYISLLFYPNPARLNLDYDFNLSYSLFSPVSTLPCIAVIVGLLVFAVYIAKRERLVSFCILWFFGNMAIESSVLGLEIVFEHRVYLPSMLVCLAVVALAWRYIRQVWFRIGLFSIVIILFSFWTYQRNNVWRDAVTLWQDCVAKSPNKARPHNNLGKEYYEQNKLDEAIKHYRLALKSNFFQAHHNLANALSLQGQYDQAISHYRQALHINPDFADAYNEMGNAFASQGNLDQAIGCYRRALQVNPDYTDAHKNLADAFALQDKPDQAIIHYRRALRLKPNFYLAHYNLANVLKSQGNLDQAISHYNQALQIKPDLPDAYIEIGNILASQGKLDQAISHYRRALQIRPDSSRVHYNLANALSSQGKLDEAIVHYREALKIDPDFTDAYNNLGNVLASQGNLDQAISYYQQALQIEPDYTDAHNNLGNALVLQGKLDQAIEHYRRALQFKPTLAETHNNLGSVLKMQGNLEQAISHYQQALKIKPDYIKAHDNLADALSSQGKFTEAIEHYNHVLKIKPDWVNSLNSLAWVLAVYKDAEFHNPEQAITLSERACELTSHKIPALLDTLSVAYAAAGRFSKAITIAEKALKLAQSSERKDLAAHIRERLALYKTGQPYIEPTPRKSSK